MDERTFIPRTEWTPTLRTMGAGFRWLATPPEGAPRFAVIGNSQDDALSKYERSADRWSELLRLG